MNASTPSDGLFSRMQLRRPPLPETADRLRSNDRKGAPTDVHTISNILSSDPLSALTILKRANHAYYGYLGSVESLTHAVELLTPRCVASFLLELSDRESGSAPVVVRRLSEHARETGRFAHRMRTGVWLFEDDRNDPPGSVFTSAMLHSVGRLILASSFPDIAETLYGDGRVEGLFVQRDWSLAERLQFGADSVEVADYVFGKLQLPETTAAVVGRPTFGRVTLAFMPAAGRPRAALVRAGVCSRLWSVISRVLPGNPPGRVLAPLHRHGRRRRDYQRDHPRGIPAIARASVPNGGPKRTCRGSGIRSRIHSGRTNDPPHAFHRYGA